VFVTELLLDGWTDFNEFFCMHLGVALDGLGSKKIHKSPTPGGAQTEILRFTMKIFVYL